MTLAQTPGVEDPSAVWQADVLPLTTPRPAERPTAIDVVGVAHTFRGQTGAVHALQPLDLEIAAGSFVAILGPSGCGKTTLLRIISGLLEPSMGHVRLNRALPAAARAQRAIGWLAQEDGLLPWRSVLDNAALPLQLAGMARAQRTAAALELLAEVGLDASARQYPHELSGGMRQRAALARALVARPAFLLLDEPFAHLDELTRERLGELVLDLRRAGPGGLPPTSVLVTHSVAEAVRLADRVIVLSSRPGRVLLDMPIDVPRPRLDDDAAVGWLVRRLKTSLGHLPPAPDRSQVPSRDRHAPL